MKNNVLGYYTIQLFSFESSPEYDSWFEPSFEIETSRASIKINEKPIFLHIENEWVKHVRVDLSEFHKICLYYSNHNYSILKINYATDEEDCHINEDVS